MEQDEPKGLYYYFSVIYALMPGLNGILVIGVPVYTVLLTTMAWRAISRVEFYNVRSITWNNISTVRSNLSNNTYTCNSRYNQNGRSFCVILTVRCTYKSVGSAVTLPSAYHDKLIVSDWNTLPTKYITIRAPFHYAKSNE